jgi:polyisoprenoid-binding protein YceI
MKTLRLREGKERAAFEAKTLINRKDFGLTWSKTLETGGLVVGDDVQISLEIEGVKVQG